MKIEVDDLSQNSDLVLKRYAFFSRGAGRNSCNPDSIRVKKLESENFNKENIMSQRESFKGKIFSSYRENSVREKSKQKKYFHSRLYEKKRRASKIEETEQNIIMSRLEEKTRNRISKYMKKKSK